MKLVWSLSFMYLQRRASSGHTVQVWRDLYGHGYHNPVGSSKRKGIHKRRCINDIQIEAKPWSLEL